MNEQYKQVIIDYCKDHEGVSFAELNREFAKAGLECNGSFIVKSERFKNLVFWHGWNEEAAIAIKELLKDKVVRLDSCELLIYLVDGEYPGLPIAKSEQSYKEPHWMPCVLNLAQNL